MTLIFYFLLGLSLTVNVYFFVGKFRKQPSKEDSHSSLLDGLMHSDKRVVLMTVLMTLAARMAQKDGHVDDSEKAVLTSNLGLEKDKFAVSNAMFEEASKLPITEDELVSLLYDIYPNIEERKKVIDFLLQIALADGVLHEKETEYLDELTKKLINS